MLDNIAFLLCWARKDGFFVRPSLLVCNLDVLLNNSSFPLLASELSEVSQILQLFPARSRRQILQDPHGGGSQVKLTFVILRRLLRRVTKGLNTLRRVTSEGYLKFLNSQPFASKESRNSLEMSRNRQILL